MTKEKIIIIVLLLIVAVEGWLLYKTWLISNGQGVSVIPNNGYYFDDELFPDEWITAKGT